jgi:hypothetical protein
MLDHGRQIFERTCLYPSDCWHLLARTVHKASGMGVASMHVGHSSSISRKLLRFKFKTV